MGIGTTDDGRPFLTNADSFLVDCIVEDDGRIHEIQLSPDYRSCECPFTARRSEIGRQNSMNIHPDVEQRSSVIPEKESGCKAEINIHSFNPRKTAGGLHEDAKTGERMPGQDSFFLNTQKPEKGLEETQINIMSNLQEAGECLALQVNGVEYQGHDDADRQEIEVEQAELRAPPARPEMKVKSIKISDIKTDAICKYCKTYDCRCLDICYSHCDSHFSHCICYDSCEECNEDPTDCECLLRCEYCHVDVEKNTFIAQGAGCDCITIAATSLAERLADNHIDIDQQDDVGSMVQDWTNTTCILLHMGLRLILSMLTTLQPERSEYWRKNIPHLLLHIL